MDHRPLSGLSSRKNVLIDGPYTIKEVARLFHIGSLKRVKKMWLKYQCLKDLNIDSFVSLESITAVLVRGIVRVC